MSNFFFKLLDPGILRVAGFPVLVHFRLRRFELVGAGADLIDGFYQFQEEAFADYFAFQFVETAGEVGVTEVWDSDVEDNVAVSASQRLYPCFLGVPMGW